MLHRILIFAAMAGAVSAQAATEPTMLQLQQRIDKLEQQLQQVENSKPAAPETSPGPQAFNPAISLILSGIYGSYSQNPDTPATGFELSPNNHGYTRSFSLKESELGFSANIDPLFSGTATLSLDPDGGISVENGYVQTTALGNGYTATFGRFYSGLGYLNQQHAHTWDFVDQPLVYRTFWDNQLSDDGVQLKWLAPTDTFLELGAELARGRNYPGSNRKDNNGAGAEAVYFHVGDDISDSSSWQAGASFHQTYQHAAEADAYGVKNSFTGDSYTTGMDFVWKYAPHGNTLVTNFKLQGEYFQRRRNGLLAYDTASGGSNITDSFLNAQSGWYLQGVYQWRPYWRAGLRYDQLNPGSADVGAALVNVPASYSYTPVRYSAMLDWSPSEFSRLRLQYNLDQSRQSLTDNQLFLQYVMSLGAHGAHIF